MYKDKNGLAQRIGGAVRQLRKQNKLTLLALADMIDGYDGGNLSRFERGAQSMASDKFEQLAKALNCKPSDIYLLADSQIKNQVNERSINYNLENKIDIQGRVPLISWVQAGDFCESADIFEPSSAEEWVPCPMAHTDTSYALRVQGSSMEPRFREGDVIIVDPDVSPDPGKFVVAKRAGDHAATFKQLMMEGGEFYLKALNPAWPEPIIKLSEEWHVCGVAICKVDYL